MSKERPILFSVPMVRALLSGAKTQTRRLVKHPNVVDVDAWADAGGGLWEMGVHEAGSTAGMGKLRCPYGAPGDRLWVRETWTEVVPLSGGRLQPGDHPASRSDGSPTQIWYRADGEISPVDRLFDDGPRWKPSIYMPRWASRIELEVTAARVERLQAISEADVKAEGIREGHHDVPAAMGGGVKTWGLGGDEWWTDPVAAYRSLWVDINGAGSWALNPWVWVVEFKRVRP